MPSASLSAAFGARQANATNWASNPQTSRTTGAWIGVSAFASNTGNCAFGFMPPKYFSITATISSGLKSPDKQMAMLLGTYHWL